MTQRSVQDQLKSFIERVERLEEEKKALQDDIRDVFNEAKATGFDVKAMREIIRRRKMDKDELAEQDAILETYMMALGMLPKSSAMLAQDLADAGVISQASADETAQLEAAVKKKFGRAAACAVTRDETLSSSGTQPAHSADPIEKGGDDRPSPPAISPSSQSGATKQPRLADQPSCGRMTPGEAEPLDLPPFLRRDEHSHAPFMGQPP